MSQIKSFSHIFTALSVGTFVAFIWFGHLADGAMDKAGHGDLPKLEHYSTLAGISFWAVLFLWVLAVVFIQISPKPYRSRALFVVGLLFPIFCAVGYAGLLIASAA